MYVIAVVQITRWSTRWSGIVTGWFADHPSSGGARGGRGATAPSSWNATPPVGQIIGRNLEKDMHSKVCISIRESRQCNFGTAMLFIRTLYKYHNMREEN